MRLAPCTVTIVHCDPRSGAVISTRVHKKTAISYCIDEENKKMHWFETAESLAAVHGHVENCLPIYQAKIVPNSSVDLMTATCDPSELEATTKFFGQWGAKEVTVTAVGEGFTSK